MKADSLGAASAVFVLGIFLSLLSWQAQPAAAAEKNLEVVPRWVRPGGIVTVKLGSEVKVSGKVYLRISGRFAVKDLPLEGEQLVRRIVEVKIPVTTRAGHYETSLVDEEGKDLGVPGTDLKIAASDRAEEKPVITKIVPPASYPTNGRYNFDIIGENFGEEVRSIRFLVNDTVFDIESPQQKQGSRVSVKDCPEGVPCLIWGWKKISIRNFFPEQQQITRPMSASLEVDGIASNRVTIILSPVDREMPAIIAFAVLAILTLLVHLIFRRENPGHQEGRRRRFSLTYLFIDARTKTYSLSQLQLILWSAAAIVAYAYIAASQALVQWQWKLCEIPENLPMLLGISVGTTVMSLGATTILGSKGAGSLRPEWGDFISSGGVFAPERLQFFLWTVIGVFGFVSATLAQDPASVTDLPRIPDSFIPLMGLSSMGYLAGKVTRKPGPIIIRVDPPPDTFDGGPLHILGENLSRRAQVIINGEPLPAQAIAVGPTAAADSDFVTELIVIPTTRPAAAGGIAGVKVVNPDGQCANI